MEVIEHLEVNLAIALGLLKVLLEAIAAVCVFLGVIQIGQTIRECRWQRRKSFPHTEVRLQFGLWLVMALEFQLGADILATTAAPSFEALGQLGAIALIRTFLNYFLNKEIEAEYELREKERQQDRESPWVSEVQPDILTSD